MKKSHGIFSSLMILALCSCSNAGASKLSYTDVETIKDAVRDRGAQVSWTREIEGDVLDENLAPDSSLYGNTVRFTHTLAKIGRERGGAVYPEYPDFALLDSRLLDQDEREAVQNFCNALSSDFYVGPQEYFDAPYIFNLVFFRDDFAAAWKNEFKSDFPAKKSDDDESGGKIALFDKWILGEPFISDEMTQVPVRFYCKQGTVDVTLYLNKKNLIYQISVDRWGKL